MAGGRPPAGMAVGTPALTRSAITVAGITNTNAVVLGLPASRATRALPAPGRPGPSRPPRDPGPPGPRATRALPAPGRPGPSPAFAPRLRARFVWIVPATPRPGS
jgi:hypothetical protein